MRNFLLLLSLALFGIAGCAATTGTSYPTGYNTPAAGTAPNTAKTFTINGITGSSGANSLAVYFSGSAGSGIAATDGTNSIKVYSTDGGSNYAIERVGANACNVTGVASASLINPVSSQNNGDGTYTITFYAHAGCSINAGNSIRGFIY